MGDSAAGAQGLGCRGWPCCSGLCDGRGYMTAERPGEAVDFLWWEGR